MKTIQQLTRLELQLLKEFTDFQYKNLGIHMDHTAYHEVCEKLARNYFKVTLYDCSIMDREFATLETSDE